MCAGGRHTLAVLEEGRVYSWGSDAEGQCTGRRVCTKSRSGAKIALVETPVVVPGLEALRGFGVACGVAHSLVLYVVGANFVRTGEAALFSRLFHGKIKSFGSNKCSQLGRQLSDSSWEVQGIEEQQVVSITAGDFHSAAVTHEGTVHLLQQARIMCSKYYACAGMVLTWGFGEQGRLGTGNIKTAPAAVLLAALPVAELRIVFVSCGGQHSLAISDDGSCWSWGRNKEGQLGHGDTIGRRCPTKIEHLASKQVIRCSAGNISSGCVCDGSKVWLWGCVKRGERIVVPQIVSSIMGASAHGVHCGKHSVFAVLKSAATQTLDHKTHAEWLKELSRYEASLHAGVMRGEAARAKNHQPKLAAEVRARFDTANAKQVRPRNNPNKPQCRLRDSQRPATAPNVPLNRRKVAGSAPCSSRLSGHQPIDCQSISNLVAGVDELDSILQQPHESTTTLDDIRLHRFVASTGSLDDGFFSNRWGGMWKAQIREPNATREAAAVVPRLPTGDLLHIGTQTLSFRA